MKVIFNFPEELNGKNYAKGPATVPDRLAYTREFKKLVKSGKISGVPRSASDQAVQASKDASEAKDAAAAKKAAKG